MEKMRLVKLTKSEYAEFQGRSGCRNFLNSLPAIELQKKQRWEGVELIGVKNEKGEVVAATGLAFRPAMKVSKYCLAQRGLLLDYKDKELLEFFVEELKKYLRQERVLYLEISPIVLWRKLNEAGEVEAGSEDETAIRNLLELGFLRRPNAEGVDFDVEVPREYVLPLTDTEGKIYSEEELLKTFHGATRRRIQKLEGVEVRELKREELGIFREILLETAKRRGFEATVRSLKHYQDEFDAYGEHIRFYLAFLDTKKRLKQIKIEQKEVEEKRRALREKIEKKRGEGAKVDKIETQVKLIEQTLEGLEAKRRRVEEVREKYGERANLATAMFIDFPNESVYLASGSVEELREFDGTLAIQWRTIRRALEEKIPLYNFYGISGDFSKGSRGVLDYKAQFRGEIREKIGEFYLPVRRGLYRVYRMLRRRKY